MKKTQAKKIMTFSDLLKKRKVDLVFHRGEEVEGQVVFISKNKILVDLNGMATGIITGRELLNAPAGLAVDKKLKATVFDSEDEEGNVILSFRGKKGEVSDFASIAEEGKLMKVKVMEANRGGLLVSSGKLKGFLPVSQLTPKNYPRVEGGDKERILQKLRDFVGREFEVKIININKDNQDVIFSERAAKMDSEKKKLDNLKIGDTIEGEISGVVDFGLFIHFDDMEGLIHISEVSWDRVEDIHRDFHVGDKVKAKIIGIDDGRISLSIKQTKKDPWMDKIRRVKVGDKVVGTVKRLTPFGAFIELKGGLEGLIHISEISDDRISDPSDILKLGEEIKAKVISMEPEEHKIGLSVKALNKKPEEKKSNLSKIESITEVMANKLQKSGIDTIEKLKQSKVEDLTKVPGIGEAKAKKLLIIANKAK